MWQMVKNSNNPEQLFNEMLVNNPQLSNVMNTIKAIGDPKTAFYTLAKQKGVDPNTIINMLK